MFGARLVIDAELDLLTPLHLGSGEVATYASIEHADPDTGDPVATSVATVMRDADGLPVIPGASAKGVLRSLVPDHAGAEELFGPEAGADRLRQGRLTAYAMRYAKSNDPISLSRGMPFADRKMPDGIRLGERGMFIAARTAIDPGTGTADDKKLFHQEMVAPRARFTLGLVLRLDPATGTGDARDCLVEALAALAAGDGVAFGKGQSLGQGRLRLDLETLRASRLDIDSATGLLEPTPDTDFVARVRNVTVERRLRRLKLRLTCDGPFIVDDTSVERERKSRLPRLNAQRQGGNPYLPGSTLAGALRARAAWLSRLRWNDHRAGERRDRILAPDDEAANRADKDRFVTRPCELTPTERLFGVTGWRGLVRIAKVECRHFAGFDDITSVKLDRFSMAPIDGALFTTRAAIDPVFSVVIEVGSRSGFPNDDDRTLLDDLLDDLRDDVLMLGHGTSRGYGWFTVEVSEDLPAAGASR